MRYLGFDNKTDVLIADACEPDILRDIMRDKGYKDFDWYCITRHSCRGCSQHKDDVYERGDWYGITTGHWCEDCYENNYPYRKDRYETIEYDGYGERLDDDY